MTSPNNSHPDQFEEWIVELGKKIMFLRKELNLTQAELAKKLHVHQSVIAKIENGQNMRCKTLWNISQVLNGSLQISFIINDQNFNFSTSSNDFSYTNPIPAFT